MSDERVVVSSGNIFGDLGLPDADEALAKADLARQIVRLINRQGWKQAEAARALGIDQPKVSALIRGRLEGFSTDRLIRFLTYLDQEVEISVRPKSPSAQHAGLRVTVEDAPSRAPEQHEETVIGAAVQANGAHSHPRAVQRAGRGEQGTRGE